MKNTLKLAAIAVSVVLAMSFIACSDSVDDIEDATTPEYLLTNQIDKYVASIEYDQNVSNTEIKSLTDAHADMMEIVGDCEECSAAYFKVVKDNTDSDKLTSQNIEATVKNLKTLKTKYNTEKAYHKRFVYRPAIEEAIDDLQEAKKKVDAIEIKTTKDSTGKVTETGKLNERQSASMSEYLDAAAALKAVLDENGANTCKESIEAADKAIKTFNELENKDVTKVKIEKVTDAVDAMIIDIQTKVVNKID